MRPTEAAEAVAVSNLRRQPDILVEIDASSHAEHAYGGIFLYQPLAHHGGGGADRDDGRILILVVAAMTCPSGADRRFRTCLKHLQVPFGLPLAYVAGVFDPLHALQAYELLCELRTYPVLDHLIPRQCIESLGQRLGQQSNSPLADLIRCQVVQIDVEWLSGLETPVDAVKSRRGQCRCCQIRIGCAVRQPQLDATERNTNAGGTVVVAVRNVCGSPGGP